MFRDASVQYARGPATILFTKRDTCSDMQSITRPFRACFYVVSHSSCATYVAKKLVLHRCACVSLSTKGGTTSVWGSANLPEKSSTGHGVSKQKYCKIVRYGATKSRQSQYGLVLSAIFLPSMSSLCFDSTAFLRECVKTS